MDELMEVYKYMDENNINDEDYGELFLEFGKTDLRLSKFDIKKFLKKYNLNLFDEDYESCRYGVDVLKLPIPSKYIPYIIIDYHLCKNDKDYYIKYNDDKKFCRNCGEWVNIDDKFCIYCGNKLYKYF